MAATAAELEQQRQRDEVLAKLKRERAEVSTRLAAVESKLVEAENADFIERLGKMQVSEMTVKEKSELVSRLGLEGFERLLGVR
jgi:hypothetical protein